MVGFDTSDDACVYRVTDQIAAIHTVDFFTPIVDDPFWFGQIAAANALSDVYAMGGRPVVAMNLLCVPNCLSQETVRKILEGGHRKAVEAGCVIAGGHTIQDNEPKYGLCVTGYVHPDKVLRNVGARPGDALVLTKPIGTGVLTTAAKADLLEPEQYDRLVRSMAQLNAKAAEAMLQCREIHACTDVTGFGLLGHADEMAAGSGVTVRIYSRRLPLLPGALELAEMGIIPAGLPEPGLCGAPAKRWGKRAPGPPGPDLRSPDLRRTADRPAHGGGRGPGGCPAGRLPGQRHCGYGASQNGSYP